VRRASLEWTPADFDASGVLIAPIQHASTASFSPQIQRDWFHTPATRYKTPRIGISGYRRGTRRFIHRQLSAIADAGGIGHVFA